MARREAKWLLQDALPLRARHQRWIHLTPSDPNYGKNLRHWLVRLDCWREEA